MPLDVPKKDHLMYWLHLQLFSKNWEKDRIYSLLQIHEIKDGKLPSNRIGS